MSKRILVVEDESLIGMDLVMMLEDWGYRASGPHASVNGSLKAIDEFDPEIAILDINLGGDETSLPVAEALQSRGTPFIFLTGYTRLDMGGHPILDAVQRIRKPVSEGELKRMVEGLSAEAGDT